MRLDVARPSNLPYLDTCVLFIDVYFLAIAVNGDVLFVICK